ncbi:MAG TPA: competence/damage-inducible protein A [Gemmatimonadaceae bacterium]|nr:competence/damage-inducible protein A [Gemmatimonadaceae bacterium]
MRIEIVTIGDELLLGFTIDTNAAHLARELAAVGVEIVHRTTVGDSAQDIADAVKSALDRTGAVITTGGLGPTSDDMTKPSIAALFGRKMLRDEAILEALKARWARYRRLGPFPESNVAQAMIPEGATIIPNQHGSAPGIWLEDTAGRWVAMLPGVPREMKGMLADELLPMIVKRIESLGGFPTVIKSRTLRTTGVAESALADELGVLASGFDGLSLAFLPSVESVDLRLTSRCLTADAADAALAAGVMKLREAAGRYVYGEDGADLAEVVLDACRRRGVTISVAESCTGGLLGARLTAVAGSSDVFIGGVMSYDNSVKRDWLGVSDTDLEDHGAVSEEVAVTMAKSVREGMKTDIGIAITGVAGPGGGTAAKPVGMVWLALDGADTQARCVRLFGTRDEVRQRAVQAALDMIRRSLQTS